VIAPRGELQILWLCVRAGKHQDCQKTISKRIMGSGTPTSHSSKSRPKVTADLHPV
jgi:hypothetical protein